MKCIKKDKKIGNRSVSEILRVSNEVAKERVENEGYKYCSKDEYKRFLQKVEGE